MGVGCGDGSCMVTDSLCLVILATAFSDRKYFESTSFSKISCKEDPLPVLWDGEVASIKQFDLSGITKVGKNSMDLSKCGVIIVAI